jgi:tetratricopeptide (TPR) repeat protein
MTLGAAGADQWRAQMAEANTAQSRHQFAAAESGFVSALRLAGEVRPNGPMYQGVSAHALGQLYFTEGRFAMAEILFLRAMAVLRQFGDRSLDRRIAANLSTEYLETGQTSRAENIIERYMDSTDAGADLDGAVLLSNLAAVRLRQRRFSESENLSRRVIDALASRSDSDSRIIRADAMGNLAAVLSTTQRRSEAEDCSHQALAILEDFANTNPVNFIKALVNVSEFRVAAGDSAGARALLERAIGTYESVFQSDQELLGLLLRRYAAVLRREKRSVEARRAEQRAARILSASEHENHLGYTVEVSSLLQDEPRASSR